MTATQDEQRNDVHVIATNWFVNPYPLVTRVPRVPVASTTFSMISRVKWILGEANVTSESQFCQTFIQPVDRERSLEDRYVPDGLDASPFDETKMDALECVIKQMERTSLYGLGEDPSMCGRPKQKGLRSLIRSHKIENPERADAYRIQDLIRDAIESARKTGGDPDVLLVSKDMVRAFEIWGDLLHRLNAGNTIYGEPIDIFECHAFQGVSVIVDPVLRLGTAVALTSSEVRLRVKRNEFWTPRSADSEDGEFVAEAAIELENEHHHAWVEGIVTYSAV